MENVETPHQQPSTVLADLHPKYANAIQLKFQDKSYKEIASLLGAKTQTVRTWFMSSGKLFQKYADYCTALLDPAQANSITVQEKINTHATKAVDKMGELIEGKSEDVQYRASKDILDRAGYAPIQKSMNIHAIDDLSELQLNDELERLTEKYIPSTVTPDDEDTDGIQPEAPSDSDKDDDKKGASD